MLVIVPMGLRLIDDPARRLARYWPAGALPGGVSLWLPRGALAAGLASGYALMTVVLAGHVPVRLVRRRSLAAREVALLTALATPAIAGSSLVAERAGYRLFGFQLGTLSLTVAHFHFAGFTAALIAALVCAATGNSGLARAAAWCVPVGTAVVFLGFFTGDGVELAGAAVLTAGMWLVGWLTWREIRPAGPDPATRVLLAVCATVLVATMLLALDWAVGHVAPVPHLPLAWMVATHGVANALGFGLCALLAWQRLPTGPAPGPDTTARRNRPVALGYQDRLGEPRAIPYQPDRPANHRRRVPAPARDRAEDPGPQLDR
jgi:hypothetical protein